jgi:hypothetical protein
MLLLKEKRSEIIIKPLKDVTKRDAWRNNQYSV